MTNPLDAPIIPDAPAGDLAALAAGVVPGIASHQVALLAGYRDRLFEHNQHTNLTAIRDLDGIERRLIVESLRLVEPLRALPANPGAGRQTLLDVGTGGGLPGLVLAIACPDLSVYLLDATGKKIAFLDSVVGELGLSNVTTIHARAEDAGHQPRYRNGFDIVTARAVSSLSTLLELGLPMLRTGGHMLLPKGMEIADELDAGLRAAAILGAEIASSDVLPPAASGIETRLVVVRKLSTTPRAYPRRSGIPAKNPLGIPAAATNSGKGARHGGGTP